MQKATQATLLAIVTSVFMAGCASNTPTFNEYETHFENNPPSNEWLEDHVNEFREKAWEEPTKDNIKTFALVKETLDKRQAKKTAQSNWQSQTHRVPTLDCISEQRGGAAFRQSSYKHVVANDGFIGSSKISACTKVRVKKPQIKVDTNKSFNKLVRHDSSFYADNAWKRYCNNGQGMTQSDWEVVKANNYRVPKNFKGKCYPPK